MQAKCPPELAVRVVQEEDDAGDAGVGQAWFKRVHAATE